MHWMDDDSCATLVSLADRLHKAGITPTRNYPDLIMTVIFTIFVPYLFLMHIVLNVVCVLSQGFLLPPT